MSARPVVTATTSDPLAVQPFHVDEIYHRTGGTHRVRARLGCSMTDQTGYGAATRERPESDDRPIGEVFSAITPTCRR